MISKKNCDLFNEFKQELLDYKEELEDGVDDFNSFELILNPKFSIFGTC